MKAFTVYDRLRFMAKLAVLAAPFAPPQSVDLSQPERDGAEPDPLEARAKCGCLFADCAEHGAYHYATDEELNRALVLAGVPTGV